MLVQFSPSRGRARRCRQISLCVGSTHHVPATLGLPRSRVCVLPIYTAQAPGCSIWSVLHIACGSSFRVLHKSADLVAPAFCAFPGLSSSGSQELDGLFLPSAAPASVSAHAGGVPVACVCSQELASSHDPPGSGCRPSRISGSLWIETGGLFAVWEGMPSLGPSLPLSPPPCLLPLTGWAGLPQASSSLEFLSPLVLRMASSVFGLVNFLSCYPTV